LEFQLRFEGPARLHSEQKEKSGIMRLKEIISGWMGPRGQRKTSAAPQPAGAGERDIFDTAFDTALRHSRRVRFLRRFIPVCCVAVLAGPVLWGVVSPYARVVPDVKVNAISLSGTKVTMEAPKLSGFRKDQKSYEVTAREAVQDIKVPTIIELNQLVARMEQEKNSFARLSSDWGRFDQTADRLDLKGNVRVRTDNGYEVDLLSARVNMKSGDVSSAEPVTVRTKTGTVSSDTVDVRENGKVVVFDGRVRSSFITTEPEAPKDGESKRP
jgi:lipopolysaccharide export system protein LptC